MAQVSEFPSNSFSEAASCFLFINKVNIKNQFFKGKNMIPLIFAFQTGSKQEAAFENELEL